MDNIVLLIVGIVLIVLGAINMTGNISTIHQYNRARVVEADYKKYGRAVGIGTFVIGVALVVGFVLAYLNYMLAFGIVTTVSIVVGVAFILYAQFKYNHGIF